MEKHNPEQLELFQGNESIAMAQTDSSRNGLRSPSLVRQYQKAIFSLVTVIFVSLVSYSFGVERGKRVALKAASSLVPLTTSAQPKVPVPSQNTADTFIPTLQNLGLQAADGAPTLRSGQKRVGRDSAPKGQEKKEPLVGSIAQQDTPLYPGAIGLKQSEKKPVAVAVENSGQSNQARTDADIPKSLKAPVPKGTQAATYTVQVASIQQRKNISKELTHLKTKGYNGFDLQKGSYTVICVGKFNAAQEAKNMQQKLKNRYPDCMIRRL